MFKRFRIARLALAAMIALWYDLQAHAAGSRAFEIFAQQQGPLRPDRPAPEDSSGGTSYVIQSIVVVVLVGVAAYSVCRSSRRV